MERNAITTPTNTAKEKWRKAVDTIRRRNSEEEERESAVSCLPNRLVFRPQTESLRGGRDT
jgi:hypothetical protein